MFWGLSLGDALAFARSGQCVIGTMCRLSLGYEQTHCLFVCVIFLFLTNKKYKNKNKNFALLLSEHELLCNFGLNFIGLFNILNPSSSLGIQVLLLIITKDIISIESVRYDI